MNTKHELYKNYIHVHAKARRQFWVEFLEYIYLVLETGTFNNLELTWLATGPWDLPGSPFPALGLQMHTNTPSFLPGFWNQTQDIMLVQKHLPTELSPRSLNS